MTDRLDALREALDGVEMPHTVDTPVGAVELTRITVTDECAEIDVANPVGGDPSFRIFNPPTLPDPISAVAHAVALHGGVRR